MRLAQFGGAPKTISLVALIATALSLSAVPPASASTSSQISGTVSELSAPQNPIAGIEVCAFPSNFEEEFSFEAFRCESTNSHGEYVISHLPDGNYDVEFSSKPESEPGYITQYWHDANTVRNATTLVVNGATISGIDAKLEEGAKITGQVTRASNGEPLKGIEVCAYTRQYESLSCGQTKSDGSYAITGLESAVYEVEFAPPYESRLNYVRQYWEYQSKPSQAAQINVKAPESVTDINAKLQEGGKIEGRVTDAFTGSAILGVLVCADGEADIGECAITNRGGEYVIQSLASGDYKILFSAERGYLAQYYDEKSSSKEAQEVVVTAPDTTPGINAAMQPVTTPPANSAPPSISGTGTVASTLLCAPGRWTGKPPPVYSYQWQRDGAAIAAANGSSYVVQSADAGHNLSCQVTAKNSAGEKNATSASITIPVPPPPPPTPPPVITITGLKLTISGKSVLIGINCAAGTPCAGSAQLSLQVTTKHRRGKKLITRKEHLTLARGTYSLQAGKSGKLLLAITAKGHKRFVHSRHHPVTVKLILSVKGGKTLTKSVRVS